MLSRTVKQLALRSTRRFTSSVSSANHSKLTSLVRCRSPKKVQRTLVELWRSLGDKDSSTNAPLPVIISKLCINESGWDVDLALNLVFSASSQDTSLALMGFLEVLNECIDRDLSKDLVRVYRHVRYMNGIMDAVMTDKFVRLAAKTLNYDAIEYVFSTQAITSKMLIEVAEALIMTGRVSLFASFLNRFLRSDPLPTVVQVVRVLRAVSYGRVRRSDSLPDLSRDEVDAINRMYSDLEHYHVRLSLFSPSMNVNECASARALKNMFYNETDLFLHASPANFPIRLPQDGQDASDPEAMVPNILKCELLPEDRGMTDFRPNDSVLSSMTIRDLTHELVSRDSSAIYLYNSDIFKGQFQADCKDFSVMQMMSGNTDGENEVHRFKMGTIEVGGKRIPVEGVVVSGDASEEFGDLAQVGLDDATDGFDGSQEGDDYADDEEGVEDDDDDNVGATAGELDEDEPSEGEYHISLDSDKAHLLNAHHLHFQGQTHYSQVRELPDLSAQLGQAFPGYFVEFEEAIFEPDEYVPDEYEGAEEGADERDEAVEEVEAGERNTVEAGEENRSEQTPDVVGGEQPRSVARFVPAEFDEDEWEIITSKIPVSREYRLQYREYQSGVGNFLDGVVPELKSVSPTVKESKAPASKGDENGGSGDSGGGVTLSTRLVNRIQRWLE